MCTVYAIRHKPTGHRAHRCPKRAHCLPWTGGDLWLATVLVALIAGWFHA